jgi:protein-disulfide isomerase
MRSKLMPIAAAALFAAALIVQPPARAETANSDTLSDNSVLRDPEIPIFGNAKGDITIVEWFDYRCPYCKKVHPDLLKVVQEDGHVRLVFKEWPVFGGVSIYAAKLALAAKYQNKYAEAHEALISATQKLSEENVQSTLAQAGIDVDRAKSDLAANQVAIDSILARNHEQALALSFQGTPAFIIGHFRVPGALDAKTFKQAVAEARTAAKKGK